MLFTEALSGFKKEILKFYAYVTRGKCFGYPLTQCKQEEEKYWEKCFYVHIENGHRLM